MTFDQITRLAILKLETDTPFTFLFLRNITFLFLLQKQCLNKQGLGVLKKKFPKIPMLALTATATASVKEDVVQALGLVNPVVFRQSFNRPNLW